MPHGAASRSGGWDSVPSKTRPAAPAVKSGGADGVPPRRRSEIGRRIHHPIVRLDYLTRIPGHAGIALILWPTLSGPDRLQLNDLFFDGFQYGCERVSDVNRQAPTSPAKTRADGSAPARYRPPRSSLASPSTRAASLIRDSSARSRRSTSGRSATPPPSAAAATGRALARRTNRR
jgi:hypothetical protein